MMTSTNFLFLKNLKNEYPLLVSFIVNNRNYILALVFVSGLINVLALVPTLYMLQVFDRIFLSKSELTLLTLTGITLFLYAIQAISEWYRSGIIISLSARLEEDLSPKLLESLVNAKSLPRDFDAAEQLAHLTQFRQWITGSGAFVFLDLPWAPIFLIAMTLLHPWLGLIAIFFMILLGLYAWVSSKQLINISRDSQEEEKELGLLVQDKLDNADVIESMGMLKNLRAAWWEKQLQHFELQFNNGVTERKISLLSRQIRILFQSLSITIAAALFIEGDLTFGSMIVASLLMSRAVAPIDMLVGGWRPMQNALESLEKVQEALRHQASALKVVEEYQFDQPYVFRRYSARSNLSDRPFLLSDINCRLQSGHVYVMLGGSGSGKSTFIKSLLGIWPNFEGSVYWGDIDIYSADLSKIRNKVGYLPQEVNLLRGTVAENIARYGDLDPAMVIKAATQVGIHEAILALPDGYNTEIGVGGGYLSGGQRQRVALARAVYGDPKLVVLDEPNSNLDREGEISLNKLLLTLKAQGSTVFVVSHRPSVIHAADGILIIKNGRLDYFNTKDQFLAQIKAKQDSEKLTKE